MYKNSISAKDSQVTEVYILFWAEDKQIGV